MPRRETNNLDSLPVTFLHSHFHLLRIDTEPRTRFSLWYFSPDSSSIICPLLPRGWFPIKWPCARPLETLASNILPVRKSPRRRWEPHTWLRNFYYSVDPNTGRGRIMAAWLPWEIQIQSVVTRLCFWISLNREQMLAQKTGRTTPRDDPQETYETPLSLFAFVHAVCVCVCVWNRFSPRSLSNLEQDFSGLDDGWNRLSLFSDRFWICWFDAKLVKRILTMMARNEMKCE